MNWLFDVALIVPTMWAVSPALPEAANVTTVPPDTVSPSYDTVSRAIVAVVAVFSTEKSSPSESVNRTR